MPLHHIAGVNFAFLPIKVGSQWNVQDRHCWQHIWRWCVHVQYVYTPFIFKCYLWWGKTKTITNLLWNVSSWWCIHCNCCFSREDISHQKYNDSSNTNALLFKRLKKKRKSDDECVLITIKWTMLGSSACMHTYMPTHSNTNTQ